MNKNEWEQLVRAINSKPTQKDQNINMGLLERDRQPRSSKGLEECILGLVKNGTSTTMSIVAKIKSEVPDISESAIRCMV